MKQKITALLLAAALLLCFMGCTVASAGSVDLMEGVVPRSEVPRVPPAAREAAAMADFGLELLLPLVEQREENPLLSPLSILSALAMTARGARGKTLTVMEKAFGLTLGELERGMAGILDTLPDRDTCRLSMANAIWFKDTPSLSVSPEFLQANADLYGAGIYKAPFDETTCRDINRWVEEHTLGMVKDVVDEIPAEAMLYLVNALCFDGEWSSIYLESQVREETFTTEAGEVCPVEMMRSKESLYLETDFATGFIKPYKGGSYAFAALLPREGYLLADCAALLDGETLIALLTEPSREPVITGVPKFESEYAAELSGALKSMGMELAFGGGDLSGMGSCTEGPLVISRVLHKTFIAVDERGTRAGAATAVEANPSSAAPPQEEPRVVVLDRPFLYFIFDTATGLPAFAGAVTRAG